MILYERERGPCIYCTKYLIFFNLIENYWVVVSIFFVVEETVILIKIHEHESSIYSVLNRFIIYYITSVPLQKGQTLICSSNLG